MNEIQRFWELAEEANRAWPDCPDTFDLEPYLLKVLELVKSAPELRPEFAQCFIECVNETRNPYELLVFCMRELRWPEVREAVEQKIESSRNWRIKTPLSHVLEVYDAQWDDADLWDYSASKIHLDTEAMLPFGARALARLEDRDRHI